MAQWEYLVRVFALNKDDEIVIDYVTREYPDRSWKEMARYDPLILEAWLNHCGSEGWELVGMEPAQAQGKHGDIGRSYTDVNNWAQYFMCVFKRPARLKKPANEYEE